VFGLQHSGNIVLPAMFRPTECLIGSAPAAHMPYVRRKSPGVSSMRRFGREHRRALELLADVPRGFREEVLILVHGFSIEMLAGLVQAGLATVETDTRAMRPGVTVETERIRITEVGRKAING
jgi:hypothetical protein